MYTIIQGGKREKPEKVRLFGFHST